MVETQVRTSEEEELLRAALRFNTKLFGLILGLALGGTIFVATNWLLLKGGHVNEYGEYVVGPHLQLLSQFLIGYKVSFVGSLIGGAYGFAIGTITGAIIARIYNFLANLRA